MQTWIALFRGINVGGNNILPMAQLRSDFESLGYEDVRTYIQSGNVVFPARSGTATSLGKRITKRIEEQHGFRPQLLVLAYDELLAATEANPFPDAVSDPKTLHFYFLAKPAAKADLAALENARSPSEAYVLTDGVFYLHAPDGVGRSRLAASAEKHLGVATTARNFRTVEKVLAMAAQGRREWS